MNAVALGSPVLSIPYPVSPESLLLLLSEKVVLSQSFHTVNVWGEHESITY